MKLFRFPYDTVQAEWIFSPVRRRGDVITLLMNAIKLMIVNRPPPDDFVAGELVLSVSKMSRLFFSCESKIISLAFPFFTETNEEGVFFRSQLYGDIDSRVTSILLALVTSNTVLTCTSALDLAGIFEEEVAGDTALWPLFFDLLTYDDGYLRYECDGERQNGHLHPLHHLDIFYSGRATFKLGLRRGIDVDGMRDVMDLLTDCSYLASA
ncbi:MAG: hypothetical protein JWQ90_2543 [Hydrocarboniphaga sp.]|uniref:hypothetical protein n=1 Tax=Hydrocarboniphaga sp. TaxID=2033016 RepID=UPI0026076244|nr:hypothetical protein [Hydrocarboniphaga sp.]MDB5970093.1 hypothetical protein [Hydrocarboniphaga sp.]